MTSGSAGSGESGQAAVAAADAAAASSVRVPSHATLLAQIKTHATPYLPPPVVTAMAAFDSHPVIADNLALLTSDEPSTAILMSVFVGFAILQLFRVLGLSNIIGGRSTLHVDEDEEYDVLKKSSTTGDGIVGSTVAFDNTVALIGPCGAGKTRLFHALCCSQGNPQQGGPAVVGTVMSMKASAGYVAVTDRYNDSASDNEAVRLIDYPGHPSLRPKLAPVVSISSRIIFFVDSTRPVADGAALLHSILTDGNVAAGWRKMLAGGKGTATAAKKIPILLACTKSDVPKSKNWRRMKIQLRSELEKLEKIGGATSVAAGAGGGNADGNMKSGVVSAANNDRLTLAKGKGGGLDLDNLGEDIAATLHFFSVGSDTGMEALEAFVKQGIIPSAEK